MLCDNEVSAREERCLREERAASQGSSQGSCNFRIDDDEGADRVDVLMSSSSSSSEPTSRSYGCNRFSCNFHQQQSHALLMLIAVCLMLMPLACIARPNNLNETETSLTDSSIVLNLANNQEVSNEIVTNLEEKPKTEETNNFMGSPLSETLEDTIRNAVKNEIEQESNVGSPALINALNVMPETENIVLVEYNSDKNATVKSEAPKVSDEKVETILEQQPQSEVKTETETDTEAQPSCDASSLVCKRVVKQDATSTTPPLLPEIVDDSAASTVAAALPIVPVDVTTTLPDIGIGATSTVEPFETTIPPVVSEPNEEQFDVIEDNEREARYLENKAPKVEHQSKVGAVVEKAKTILEHRPSKDVLKSIISIENVKGNKGELEIAEPEILDYKAYNASTRPAVESEVIKAELSTVSRTELQTTTQSFLINENIKGESQTSTSTTEATLANDLKGESNAEFDILKHQHKLDKEAVREKVVESESKTAESEIDLSELISEPLMKELVAQEASDDSNVNQKTTLQVEEHQTNESVTPKPLIEPISAEISNNDITNVSAEASSDVITPVVADHTDLYAQVAPIVSESENDNGTLSITYEESLNATEPNSLLEHLPVMAEIDVEKLAVEFATITPEVIVHNVIKKQGVEPLFEDTETLDTTSAPSPIDVKSVDETATDSTQAATALDSTENITPASTTNETETVATTIKSNDITEMSVVFAGKNDNDAVPTAKGSRSINSIHTEASVNHKASISFDVYPAGQTFNENLAEEMPNGIGKALPTHRHSAESSNRSALIIAASSCVAVLFIVISVTIFMVSFQRQHGTLDIEMQERRCGKDIQDDEPESCIKLLPTEVPKPKLALQTGAEAEIEECL